jgi:hypothetical protein
LRRRSRCPRVMRPMRRAVLMASTGIPQERALP